MPTLRKTPPPSEKNKLCACPTRLQASAQGDVVLEYRPRPVRAASGLGPRPSSSRPGSQPVSAQPSQASLAAAAGADFYRSPSAQASQMSLGEPYGAPSAQQSQLSVGGGGTVDAVEVEGTPQSGARRDGESGGWTPPLQADSSAAALDSARSAHEQVRARLAGDARGRLGACVARVCTGVPAACGDAGSCTVLQRHCRSCVLRPCRPLRHAVATACDAHTYAR